MTVQCAGGVRALRSFCFLSGGGRIRLRIRLVRLGHCYGRRCCCLRRFASRTRFRSCCWKKSGRRLHSLPTCGRSRLARGERLFYCYWVGCSRHASWRRIGELFLPFFASSGVVCWHRLCRCRCCESVWRRWRAHRGRRCLQRRACGRFCCAK